MNDMKALHALHALLDANLLLPPEYADQLSNHLPMALHALHRLGAGPARLRAFHTRYAARFEGSRPPAAAPPLADWRGWPALRGQPDAFATLLSTFGVALGAGDQRAVLREVLPQLMPGVAAAAFHGLIRTAHAIEAGHSGELAAALAYWAWRWQPLPAAPAPALLLPFDGWSAALLAAAAGSALQGPLISGRMRLAAETAPYRQLADALDAGPAPAAAALRASLLALAADLYAATGNFTVLHMVTAVHALRTVLPALDGAGAVAAALPHVLRAVTAACLAARLPRDVPPPAQQRSAGWPEVLAAALASDDDHVVKLVQACHAESATGGAVEAVLLRAARRAALAPVN